MSCRVSTALVVAIISFGFAFNANAQGKPKEDPNIFEQAEDAGFSLRRTISGPAKPATFGYQRVGSEDFFASQFALIYFSPRPISEGKDYYLGMQMAVEGNLTSQSDSRANNSLRINPALIHVLTFDPTTITGGLYSRFGAVYEADKNFKIQNVYFEYEVAPVYRPLAIAAYSEVVPGVYFRWTPILTVQVGQNVRRDAVTVEQSDTIARIVPQLHVRFAFDAMAKRAGLKAINLDVAMKEYLLASEASRRTNFMFESSLEFAITKEFSFNVIYKNGREPPKFVDAKELTLQLGVKFGAGSRFDPGG